MAKRVIKSRNKTGRLTRAKIEEAVRAIRRKYGPVIVPKGKIVITNETTASGRGLIAFRVPKPVKVGKPKADRRSTRGK